MYLKSIHCAIFAVSILLGQSVCAEETFAQWKDIFYDQALAAGVKKQILNTYMPQMDLLPEIIEQDTKLPEYIPTFASYISTRLKRTDDGRKMAQKYSSLLQHVSNKYKIPPEYLLALWGMETNYGRLMGNVDMLDALASLAYHPRRRTFFSAQLISYLKILGIEPEPPKVGSWDAGFGHFQFMPGTFEMYAVDGDGDKARDLIASLPDAFSSAANYLHQLGWKPEELWGREVIIPQNINWNFSSDDIKPVRDWIALGIGPAHLKRFPDDEYTLKASLVTPMGSKGPAFLTYPNFQHILHWNKHELYALSACLLADAIADRFNGFRTQPSEEKITSEEIKLIQQRLIDMKLDLKNVDGRLGKKTKQALQKLQAQLGLIPDGFPDRQLLDLLTTTKQEEN